MSSTDNGKRYSTHQFGGANDQISFSVRKNSSIEAEEESEQEDSEQEESEQEDSEQEESEESEEEDSENEDRDEAFVRRLCNRYPALARFWHRPCESCGRRPH
jgi:hypothetical protein